ncbi:MAG: helix-turn-helix domain-containing protein [Dehalococcoidia bacterium]
MAFITVKQAAKMLQVHPNTIRNWIEAGILRRYQVSRGYRVLLKTEDIDQAFGEKEVPDGAG